MNADRISRIRELLQTAFNPVALEIEDQSHLHAGHAGARGGMGHYKVTIASHTFEGQPPIKCHRMVYEALGDLMETDIHALIIVAEIPPKTG